MFIPLKMVLIGIDPYPYSKSVGDQRTEASAGGLVEIRQSTSATARLLASITAPSVVFRCAKVC